jgi:hypothetical protein
LAVRKYFIYITIIAVLLIACYYRESIEDSLDQKLKDARSVSPFTGSQMAGEIQHAMGR